VIVMAIIGLVLTSLLVLTWLAGPYVRETLADRRRLQLLQAQFEAEQRIRAATQATLSAMRAATRHYFGGEQ
jgi:hypothetical protein